MSTPDLTARTRAWTYRRQHLDRGATDPLDTLRAVVAVYSSHPTAPLSLLARCPNLTAAAFTALEESRRVVRIPAMRTSIFLAPAETAARIFAATRQPLEKFAGRLKYAGFDTAAYERLKEQILPELREPVDAATVQAAFAADANVSIGLRILSREGLVLRVGGSLRADTLRYVATEAWLGQPLEPRDPDESLAWLAEAYLRGFGPARVADFAWWSGAPKRRAAAALARVPTVDVGEGYLLPADQAADFARAEPPAPDALALLPKWDAYTMGYAPNGRQRLLADEHLSSAYTGPGGPATSGDGLPLVLCGGRAVAAWRHRFSGDRMAVEVTPLAGETVNLPDDAFAGIGTLLGATHLAVSVRGPDTA